VSGATMQVDEERAVEPSPGRYPLLSSLLPTSDAFQVQPRGNVAAARAGIAGAVPLTAPVTVDDAVQEWYMGRGDKRTKKGKRRAKSNGNSRPDAAEERKKRKANAEESVLDVDLEQPALAEREELLAALDRALEKAEARVGDAVVMVAGATKNKKAKAATRKAKTSSAASKRFKPTSTGKLLRHYAGKAHLTGKKPSQQMAKLRRTGQVSEPQLDTYQALLGVTPKKTKPSISVEELDVDETLARAGVPTMTVAEVEDLEEVLDAAEDTALLLEMLRLSKVDASRRGFPSMSTAVEDVMEKLKSMTLLEASELVKAIEETFDVDASVGGGMMMAAPMAGGAVAGGGAGEAAAEKTEFDLVLDSFPADKKIAVLKIVREITGAGLKDAKDMVEKAPCTLKTGASKAECDEAKAKLEEAGAKVELK